MTSSLIALDYSITSAVYMSRNLKGFIRKSFLNSLNFRAYCRGDEP